MVELRLDGTNLVATWTEPVNPNGILSYIYSITGTPLSPLLEMESTVIAEDQITMETTVSVEFSVSFFSLYEITVTPFTGAGRGNSTTGSFMTDEGGTYYVD